MPGFPEGLCMQSCANVTTPVWSVLHVCLNVYAI